MTSAHTDYALVNIPTIETERLRLRGFQGGDLEPYAEMYADDGFARYLGGKTLTKEEMWENMALILGHWSLLGYGIWAVEHRGTGELVGRAGRLNLQGSPDVEVCWAFSPKFWGNGYATEAAWAAIDRAFRAVGIHRLISLIHPENRQSDALALRTVSRADHVRVEADQCVLVHRRRDRVTHLAGPRRPSPRHASSKYSRYSCVGVPCEKRR